MRALRTWIRIALVRIGFRLGSTRPIGTRVVLATSHLPALEGNLAWIHAALVRRNPRIAVTVLVHQPKGARTLLWSVVHALRSGYQLATARLFVVDDYYFPMYVISPRSGTSRVQVWHASGAFKKFGYSVVDKSFGADEEMIRRVRIHSNYDLCLVSAMSFVKHYAEAFRQPEEVFTSRLGIPRTDLFFDEPEMARRRAAVRDRYGLRDDARVILYAPTYRGDSVTSARHAELLDLDELMTLLGRDHVLLLRLHPFARGGSEVPSRLREFVVDVSGHPDISDLMLVSDIMVTDYSSAIYEYSLLGRPMAFFAPDRDAYQRERGFYFDYDLVPGPVVSRTAELAACIRANRFDTARIRAFARASFDVADGRSSARFIDDVVLPSLAGRALPAPPH